MGNRDWATAIQLLKPLLSELDGHAPVEAYRMLGVSLHQLGELDAAEKVYERARAQYPRVIRIDIQWAQVAMVRADWPEAIRRLESIVARYDEDEIPERVYERLAKAYRRLAGEHQQRGEFELAEATIREVRPRFPGHIGLAIQWAQIAVVRGDWEEATRRLEGILATDERNAPPEVYRRLARAYQELGDFHTAAAVVARGRARYPDDVQLMMRWADVALAQGNLSEGIRRLEIAIANAGEDTATLYLKLANAYRRSGDIAKAVRVIDSARALLEPDVGIEMFRASLALGEGRVDDAKAIYASIVNCFPVEDIPPALYSRLAGLYRRSGDVAAAAEVISTGRLRLPEDLTMAMEWAEVAMILEEWPEAISRWEEARVLADQLGSPFVLPEQGSDLMWHEASWMSLARHWPGDTSLLRVEPSLSLYMLVARLLERLGEAVIASRLLEIATTIYKGDRSLAVAVLLNELELAKPGPGAPSDPSAVGMQLPHTRSLDDFDEMVRTPLNTEALDNFAPIVAQEGLPELRRIRIPVGSSLEVAVRAGRFFNRPAIDRKIREVSETDKWPELSKGSRPLQARARELADQYCERFEEPPLLTTDVLSDSVFYLIYSELCVYEPMRRLARVIASEAGEDPVFIEISGDDIEYLSVLTPTEMGQIYLYAELRRQGVNAFLCEFVERGYGASPESGPIVFRPDQSLLRARPTTKNAKGARHAVAVIPAGIRSIGNVVEGLTDPLVYSSGFIIQEFAYDRSFFTDLELAASIHPPLAMRACFKIGLWSAGSISSIDLLADVGSTIDVPIESSAPLGMDWLEWLARAVQQQLVEMAKNSHVEVLARAIKEAHVSDHLYPESALFAGAVKAAGGSVTLWPHSANPVHEDVRRTGSFDVVYAVTRSGCEAWRTTFPEVSVIHRSDQMLPPPRTRSVQPRLPLSVVILGGKNVLGQMPFVDQTARDRSYVTFFQGLQRLRDENLVRVYYKPKGTKGETEAWLERIVGRTASWEPVFLHPARLDLPNMIFVSISVGSSGLLEGMGRGVPGLLVQDHDSADYTTLSSDGIPIGSSQQILEVIEHCAQPGGLEKLIRNQFEYYVGETSYEGYEIETG